MTLEELLQKIILMARNMFISLGANMKICKAVSLRISNLLLDKKMTIPSRTKIRYFTWNNEMIH